MAVGDFSGAVTYHSEDELGELADCFRATGGTLKVIVDDLYHMISEFTKGNFDVRSNCRDKYVGDYAPLLVQLREMVITISEVLGNIQGASDQVAAGSAELAKSAQGLAEGAAEQADSVEELLETVTEVTSQVESVKQKSTSISAASACVRTVTRSVCVTSPKVCALRCSNWQSVRFPENSGVLLITEGRRFLYGHSFCIILMDSLIKLFLFFTAS